MFCFRSGATQDRGTRTRIHELSLVNTRVERNSHSVSALLRSIPVLFLKFVLFWLSLIPIVGMAQTLERPKINSEKKGRVTNHSVQGSLAPAQSIGCIQVAQAKNTFVPPDIYQGVRECVNLGQHNRAADLLMLAAAYAEFDKRRVADSTAGQAATVLLINSFSGISGEQREKALEIFDLLLKTPESLKRICAEIRAIGIPDYYPKYMILHGMKAFFANPHEGALIKNFDAKKAWEDIQFQYMHCPNERR